MRVCFTRVCTYRECTRYNTVQECTHRHKQTTTKTHGTGSYPTPVIAVYTSVNPVSLSIPSQPLVNRRLETATPKHVIKIVYHARILYNSVQFCTILYNSVQFSGIRYVAVLSVKRAQYNFLLDNREIAQLS